MKQTHGRVTDCMLLHALAYLGVSSSSFLVFVPVLYWLRVRRSAFPARHLVREPLLPFSRRLRPERRIRVSDNDRTASKLPRFQLGRVERCQ